MTIHLTAEEVAGMNIQEIHDNGYYITAEVLDTVPEEKLLEAIGTEDEGPPAWCGSRFAELCEMSLVRRGKRFDPRCAEFESRIVTATTWDETRKLMSEYHAWFRERYAWDDDSKEWILRPSFNGRTTDSDSVYRGSNP